jgi:hypothetical protein
MVYGGLRIQTYEAGLRLGYRSSPIFEANIKAANKMAFMAIRWWAANAGLKALGLTPQSRAHSD